MPINRRQELGLDTSYFTIIYSHSHVFPKQKQNLWGIYTIYVGRWGHVEIVTRVFALGGNTPPSSCPEYQLPCSGVIEPPVVCSKEGSEALPRTPMAHMVNL